MSLDEGMLAEVVQGECLLRLFGYEYGFQLKKICASTVEDQQIYHFGNQVVNLYLSLYTIRQVMDAHKVFNHYR